MEEVAEEIRCNIKQSEKVTSRDEAKSYRPISLFPYISKQVTKVSKGFELLIDRKNLMQD